MPPSKKRAWVAPSPIKSRVILLQLVELFEQIVRRLNNAGVRLVGALGDNHVGQLLGQFHVRRFQRRGFNRPYPVLARLTQIDFAGVARLRKHVAGDGLQCVRVIEVSDRQFVEPLIFAIVN